MNEEQTGFIKPVFYVLNENRLPKIEPNVLVWSAWMKKNNKKRRVAKNKIGCVIISTVFLGVDTGWEPDEPPQVFETKIFGGQLSGYQKRYFSWDKALEGHAKFVERVKVHAH